MLFGKRLAVPCVGQQHVVIVAGLQRQIRRIVVIGFEQDEFRQRDWFDDGQDMPKAHAFPCVVEAAPRCHTMEIGDVFKRRLSEELLPRPGYGIGDKAADCQCPVGQGDLRLVA